MLSMIKSEKFKFGQISSTYFKTLTELSSESNLPVLRARRPFLYSLWKQVAYMYMSDVYRVRQAIYNIIEMVIRKNLLDVWL